MSDHDPPPHALRRLVEEFLAEVPASSGTKQARN